MWEWRKAAQAGAAAALGPKAARGKDWRDPKVEQLRLRAENGEAELARTKAPSTSWEKPRAFGDALREHGHTHAAAGVINPAV